MREGGTARKRDRVCTERKKTGGRKKETVGGQGDEKEFARGAEPVLLRQEVR